MKTAPVVLAAGERLLTIGEVADMLQLSVKTLYDWSYRGEGPRPTRLGRTLRYLPADVAAYLTEARA